MAPGTFYCSDCLDRIQCWNSRCVDLIYLYPLFNPSANYDILFG